MRNICKKNHLLLIVLSVFFVFKMFGCSTDTTDEVTDTTETEMTDIKPPKKELVTVKDTIEAVLSDAMDRLMYWDNTGLYENEFAYYTDEFTFDDYLKTGQISYKNPSTVIDLVVDSLYLFEHDSAEVWVTITLEHQDGKTEQMSEQRLITYWHKGKWIKPTISVIQYQVEYDELIRQAEEAAKWEEEG